MSERRSSLQKAILLSTICLCLSTSLMGQGSKRIFGSVTTHGDIDSFFLDLPLVLTVKFKGDSTWKTLERSVADTFSFLRMYLDKPVQRIGFSKLGFDTLSIAINGTLLDTLPKVQLHSLWKPLVAKVYIDTGSVKVEYIRQILPMIDHVQHNVILPPDDSGESMTLGLVEFELGYQSPLPFFFERGKVKKCLMENAQYLGDEEVLYFEIQGFGLFQFFWDAFRVESQIVKADLTTCLAYQQGNFFLFRHGRYLDLLKRKSPVYEVQLINLTTQ